METKKQVNVPSNITSLRIKDILDEWKWARGLCLDLLNGLSENVLFQSPLQSCGSWGKQFRHLGRVQENYVQALRSGTIKFTPEGCSYKGGISKKGLRHYLEQMDEQLLEAVVLLPSSVDWFGEKWSPERHLQALVTHEILHHGQFILYARVSGIELPPSWKAWGET